MTPEATWQDTSGPGHPCPVCCSGNSPLACVGNDSPEPDGASHSPGALRTRSPALKEPMALVPRCESERCPGSQNRPTDCAELALGLPGRCPQSPDASRLEAQAHQKWRQDARPSAPYSTVFLPGRPARVLLEAGPGVGPPPPPCHHRTADPSRTPVGKVRGQTSEARRPGQALATGTGRRVTGRLLCFVQPQKSNRSVRPVSPMERFTTSQTLAGYCVHP